MNKNIPLILVTLSVLPHGVGAGPGTLKDILSIVTTFIDAAIGLVIVLALVAFIWGLVKYMFMAGDDASRKSGRQLMIWGTFALFLMVSFWGVIRIIKVSFFG